jgi:hypothetical protein
MIRINKTGEAKIDRQPIDHGKLFKWIACGLAVVAACQFAQTSWSRFLGTMLHMNSFPASEWWTILDVRGFMWLLFTPLLAAIIADWQKPLPKIVASHLIVFAIIAAIASHLVHHIEHVQCTQLSYSASAAQESSRISGEQAASVTTNSEFASGKPQSSEKKAGNSPKCFGWWIFLMEIPRAIVTYLMTISVGYAVLYFNLRERRKRQSEQLRRALERTKRESLFSRLQPHFLFNTLNTISALTTREPDSARRCITQLGQLLRHSIEVLPAKRIDLQAEIEILRCYLELQKTRYGDRLEYSIDVEPEVSGIEVPAFVLQPIVENCFQHGFYGKSGVCRIDIVFRKLGDQYRIEVRDNGIQFDGDPVVEERVGLGLTRQRLQLQYDGMATVELEPNAPVGLVVVVSIPVLGVLNRNMRGNSHVAAR